MTDARAEFDSPWKRAIVYFFEALMLMIAPQAHAEIDWTKGVEFLDKELQSLLPDAEIGSRAVDVLAKVWRRDGQPAWILAHLEVQAQRQTGFAKRMYVYNYRIFDHFDREVMSLAILADDDPNCRPDRFGYDAWGCKPGIVFPICKLLDYENRWEELEASDNPFAVVIMAHLKTLSTRSDLDARYRWKFTLTRMLFQKEWVREDIVQLLRFMDWVMILPPDLEMKLDHEIETSEGGAKVEYLANFERRAMNRGILQKAQDAVLSALEIRFEAAPPDVAEAIGKIEDVPALDELHRRAILTTSLDEFKRSLGS